MREDAIPAALAVEAEARRVELIDAVSMYCDELAEAYLDGKETEEQIRTAVRKGVLSLDLTPVFVGSAYKNKGVQPLLDARRRLSALAARPSVQRARPRQRRSRSAPCGEGRHAHRGARVQARRRPLRPAHLHPHLPGLAQEGRRTAATTAPAGRSRWAGSCACTPTPWKTSSTLPAATSWPCSASTAPRATPSRRQTCVIR